MKKEEKNKVIQLPVKVQKTERPGLRTIFIGGIPIQSKYKEIASYIATYDFVESLKLPKDAVTGKLRGFGKAILGSVKGVERITAAPYHMIGGLKVGITRWKDTSAYEEEKKLEGEKKVYVKYPPGIRGPVLINYFLQFGEILSVDHKRNPDTNKQRFFCYILFENLESAKDVIMTRDHYIQGYLVICEPSIPLLSDNPPKTAKYKSKSKNNAGIQSTESWNHSLKYRTTPKHDNHVNMQIEGQSTHPKQSRPLPKISSSSYDFKPAREAKPYESNSQEKDQCNPIFVENREPSRRDRIWNSPPSQSGARPFEKSSMQRSVEFPPDVLSLVSQNHREIRNLRFNVRLGAPVL